MCYHWAEREAQRKWQKRKRVAQPKIKSIQGTFFAPL
nr:MAG TPA: ATPase [Caudoviricetes sp.]